MWQDPLPQTIRNLGREVRHIRKENSETKCLRKLHEGRMNRTNSITGKIRKGWWRSGWALRRFLRTWEKGRKVIIQGECRFGELQRILGKWGQYYMTRSPRNSYHPTSLEQPPPYPGSTHFLQRNRKSTALERKERFNCSPTMHHLYDLGRTLLLLWKMEMPPLSHSYFKVRKMWATMENSMGVP